MVFASEETHLSHSGTSYSKNSKNRRPANSMLNDGVGLRIISGWYQINRCNFMVAA